MKRETVAFGRNVRMLLQWLCSVRNIPKFKDRANFGANWSCDTFQPMRRRACVYQQTNQNMIKHRCCDQIFSKQPTESDKISYRLEAVRHIFKTFHEAYTIFLSGQRIGSHIGSVSWNIQHILWLISSFKQRDVWARFWSIFKVGEQVSIIFSIHRFFLRSSRYLFLIVISINFYHVECGDGRQPRILVDQFWIPRSKSRTFSIPGFLTEPSYYFFSH